jgi:probable phosphoglycerate mutase
VRPTELVLLRHGESTWNAERRFQGHGDPPLSALGREQASAVARDRALGSIDAIICSDLLRAKETAAIVGNALTLPWMADARWRERAVGAWTGLTRDEIRSRWPEEYARLRSGDMDFQPGGGECRTALLERAREAALATAAAFPGARVLVITHRGVIRAIAPGVRPRNGELHEFRLVP